MRKIEVKEGDRYGRLTVIKEVESIPWKRGRRRMVLCKCDCGTEKVFGLSNIRRGTTTSCGCYYKEVAIKLRGKYGEFVNTKLYGVWKTMKQRCYDSNKQHYECYGGRGIVVCDEWKTDFLAFYNWALNNGYKEGLTIDRINNDGNYEPSNCRWVSQKEQSKNRRTNVYLTFNGETHTISDWSELLGVNPQTLQNRKYLGWTDEQILTTPIRGKNLLEQGLIKKGGQDEIAK